LTPDYRIWGRIVRESGGQTLFDYFSSHHQKPAVENPFYRALLTAPPEAETGSGNRSRRNLPALLGNYLRRPLPEFLFPSTFVMLNALPLTPAGKIDVRALPAPEYKRAEVGAEFISPRTELESTIARTWLELLGVPKVGIHDNFFDMGGHSLMIVRLQSRLRERLNTDISLTDLFRAPTVSSLAEALAGKTKATVGVGLEES